MNDIFFGIIFIGFALSIFSFGIAIYINLWIYYSVDKNKYPLFPILNPFSFSSYELLFRSIFKLKWKVEGHNVKLKRRSNKLRRFSGTIIALAIAILSFTQWFFT